MNKKKPEKILIIRNDKLGDFVLSLPVFSLIKKYYPNCQLHALVPNYTSELALTIKSIDQVIIDPGASENISKQLKILNKIRSEKYDAIITLYSTTRMGLLTFASGVRYRLAPATKLAQIFYNHKLVQRRSRSLKPEYEYNLDLAKHYLSEQGIANLPQQEAPYLHFDDLEVSKIHNLFCEKYNINSNNKLIFVHPGTGGSATNLSIKQYANLIKSLNTPNAKTFVITAGPDEIGNANKLSKVLQNIPHVVYHSTNGIVHFSKLIQSCDLFISASTGPLHIAGALNRPTAAFYQRRRSATPLRWQTLNSEDKRLAFTPAEDQDESDLTKIDVKIAADEIIKKFIL